MSARDGFVVARAVVSSVERISPSFTRIRFGGDDLDRICTPGHTFDQRIKVIVPPKSGLLPDLGDERADWYRTWLAVPEECRGSMRTYSVRDVWVEAGRTTLVVDVVIHEGAGATGPGSQWAAAARPGAEVLVVGPRRGNVDGGIEFDPGDAKWVLLAGDETAAPAISRILEDCGPDRRGLALIEVPTAADALPVASPPGFSVQWLPRDSRPVGDLLVPAVLTALGAVGHGAGVAAPQEDLVWETCRFSSGGEPLPEPGRPRERYVWIAGESGMVTSLRRRLVDGVGLDRSEVAFMGYWRRGVAMRG